MYVSAETDTYTPWGSEAPIECMLVKEEGNASYSKLPFNGIDRKLLNRYLLGIFEGKYISI